ncbi:hypothetical protein niasHT_028291 [Heterodera trifolii]|uniref:7TM GPCR serpentine receptor class x (Srx) domain-containing protein n=1 Tax=Heterodera trifolii TaxID=157864 RepID=A0ABD2JGR0_9BILA
MSFPSGTVLLFGYIFFTFELFTYGIVLSIAFLNLAVICPTKILHVNLKSILITQTCAEMLYVLVRSVMLVQKFTFNDPFAPSDVNLQSIIICDSLFRHWLGHVLIIERFLATVRTNSYENFSKFGFTLAWFGTTFIIAFLNTITNGESWTVTQFNLITQTISTLLSLIEYLVSDNVKTAKQLSPTFLCLFLSNLFMNFLYSAIAFNMVTESYQISLTRAFGIWADAVFGAAIELTMMTHHPLLKRRMVTHLKRIFCIKGNQIGDVTNSPAVQVIPSAATQQPSSAVKSIDKRVGAMKEKFCGDGGGG